MTDTELLIDDGVGAGEAARWAKHETSERESPPDPEQDEPGGVAVMALSGGMDSTGLLVHLLAEGYTVHCLSFYYGQKHNIELTRAKANVDMMQAQGLNIETHKMVDLSQAMGVFHSALTSDSIEVPEGHYEQDNMIATVVPNRNAIFSSLTYGYALSISTKYGCDVEVCLGVHSGDHAIYPDCRPEFYEAIGHAFTIGNWGSEKVRFNLPFLDGDKTTILQRAEVACDELNLDFNRVFANTCTSYNPDEDGRSSGKSGADVERILAFIEIGREDPIEYVGGWDTARDCALAVQAAWEAKVE